MNKRIFTLQFLGLLIGTFVLAQMPDSTITGSLLKDTTVIIPLKNPPVESEGLFFTDATQTKLYTGEYKEFYKSGALRLEMYLENGKPEGSFVVYFESGKPNEIRAYRNGLFQGVWRTYNENGNLIAQAEYVNNIKHGKWLVWDDNGILRYEMYYSKGKKTGDWYMWDEKGRLISEKHYE